MTKEMIISTNGHETMVAILEDDLVAEIFVERERQRGVVGNVYKGRVSKVLPGMQSSFIDLGLERDGFLYVAEVIDTLVEFDKLAGDDEDEAAGAGNGNGSGHAGCEPHLTAGEHRAARAGPVRLELLQRSRAVVHARLREPRPLLRSAPGQGRLRRRLPQRHARHLREAAVVGQRELELHARVLPCRRAPLLQGRGDRGRPVLLPPRRLSRRRVAHTAWRSCSTSARRRIFPAGVRGIASTKRTARMRL